jgi:predicted glycosyltransferase
MCQRFNRNMERLIGVADAVVSMGGYNTVCEIMSQRKPLLMLPRTIPREEQLIRARVLSQRGYCDYLDQRTLTAPVLRERVLRLLENREQYSDKLSSFPLTGLDHILRRIQARDETSQWETLAAASE